MPFRPSPLDIWFKGYPLGMYPFETALDDTGHIVVWLGEELLWLLIVRDEHNERCGHQEFLRLITCIMPKGHDTPHFPVTDELLVQLGPLVVREVSQTPFRISP